MSRVKEDDSLKNIIDEGPNFLHRPVIIIQALEHGKQQYIMRLGELDALMSEPKLFGIILSDLVDHIAAAYHQATGRSERELRDTIMRTLRKENEFKEQDPNRGGLRGTTIMPKAN